MRQILVYAGLVLLFVLTTTILHAKHHVFSPQNAPKIKLIENKGQWDAQVLFRADIPGGKMFITRTGLTYSFYDEKALHDASHSYLKNAIIKGHNFNITYVGGNSNQVQKYSPSFESYNYFKGNAATWASDCKAYDKVVLQNMYPGIDIELNAQPDVIKINYIVKPGANPSLIQLKYDGVSDLTLQNGNLLASTSLGIVQEDKPLSFQKKNGEFNPIESSFLLQQNTLRFSIGSYSHTDTLVIDPTLLFSTFSGSVADNFGHTATFDQAGNAYAGGTVYDVGFPTTIGAFQTTFAGGDPNQYGKDAGILKFDATGTQLIYCTYLGGSMDDQPHSIVCTPSGELVIFGTTNSNNFPVTTNGFDKTANGNFDIFVTKLSANGNALVGSTYIGGLQADGINGNDVHSSYDVVQRPLTYNYGDFYRGDVQLDDFGNIYVATSTQSFSTFPIAGGFQPTFGGSYQDGCVFALNAQLSNLLFSTYIGGNGLDACYGMVVDNNYIFVSGGTKSSNLPALQNFPYKGDVDGFVAKIKIDGSELTSFIYTGTPNYDQTYFIQKENNTNRIYITGQSEGNFPVTAGCYSNGLGKQFIQAYSYNLDALQLSTVFGISTNFPDLSPSAFLVDVCGRVYFSGWGGSTNISHNNQLSFITGLPITANAFQKGTTGSDFYLIVFGKDLGSLQYASFFGGNTSAEHVDGGTSRFDKNGIVYQSVCAGCGGYSDFPTTPGVWSNINKGKRAWNHNIGGCNNAIFKMSLNVSENAPFLKDTLIRIFASDNIDYRFFITDADGDSIYVNASGTLLSRTNNPASLSIANGIGIVSGRLTFNSTCSDISTDTFVITISMRDNGCPLVRTSSAKIKILISPPPILNTPFIECLKTVNDSTINVKWSPVIANQYGTKMALYRSVNNSSYNKISPDFTDPYPQYFFDNTAKNHITDNYCYLVVTENVCKVTDTSRTVCSIFKPDSANAFRVPKDSVFYILANDTQQYELSIYSKDSKDSVFINYDGAITTSNKTLSIEKSDSMGKATIRFVYTSGCNDIGRIDTPFINFYAKDNQCPPRYTKGRAYLVTKPPKPLPVTFLDCITNIDIQSVKVTWSAYAPSKNFSKLILLKKKPNGSIQTLKELTTTDAGVVIDKDAPDNTNIDYCYALTSIDKCGFYGDTSVFKCSSKNDDLDLPAQLPFYTVTVSDKTKISMLWKSSNDSIFRRYLLYKKPLDAVAKDFSELYATSLRNDTTYLDEAVKVNDFVYCYRISQENRCELKTKTPYEACSILLKGVSNPFEHLLRWNDYEYWNAGVKNYELRRTNPIAFTETVYNGVYKQTVFNDMTLDKDYGLYKYEVTASEGTTGNGYTSLSNEVELLQKPLLHVPNAFTPNGDAINDTWKPIPVFVKTYHLLIYDRWGKLVFETRNKHQDFDGKSSSGNWLTNDVYVYLITYTGWDDSEHFVKGNFTILD